MLNIDPQYGALVFPNGEIHYTKNILSHLTILNELNLIVFLQKKGKELYPNISDLTEIAVRLNYLRVITFKNQFCIEYFDKILQPQKQAIFQIYKDSIEYSNYFPEAFILENLKDSSVNTFLSFQEMYYKIN